MKYGREGHTTAGLTRLSTADTLRAVDPSGASWRQSPFVSGRKYRVRRDFKSLRDNFRTGEILTYAHDSYSRYDNYTGYFFSQAGTDNLRVWDVHDDGFLGFWKTLFEEV